MIEYQSELFNICVDICNEAKRIDRFNNGALDDLVPPYLLNKLRAEVISVLHRHIAEKPTIRPAATDGDSRGDVE